MIYKWEECPASTLGKSNKCLNCLNWLDHVQSSPDCYCHTKFEVGIDPEKYVNLEKLSSRADGVFCSKCNKAATRDYPVYHIAESIIDPLDGIPNAPHCRDCRV